MRVGISGGYGRMGTMISRVIEDASDLELGARYDPGHGGPDMLAGSDVIVEVTRPDVVLGNLEHWKAHGSHVVVGTSGFDTERLTEASNVWEGAAGNCLIVPNFSIGAVLMMRFAELAAAHFPTAEVIEAHRPEKADAPSGTALATAHRIAEAQQNRTESSSSELVEGARGASIDGVPVHSLRIAGVIADQEVIFGDPGQTLVVRHHTHSLEAFAPGVLLAVRNVTGLDAKFLVGLEQLLSI